MSQLVSYLNANCKSQWSGRVWLDIEGSQYWMSSHSSNQAWYEVSAPPTGYCEFFVRRVCGILRCLWVILVRADAVHQY
jgi:hypothetical protein